MPRTLLLHKPFGVLCQFTDARGRPTLADFVDAPGLYAAGRLDFDSEGLVVLTDVAWVKTRLTAGGLEKTYRALVEGEPDDDALARLAAGPVLADGPTHPARVRKLMAGPAGDPVLERLGEREPPPAPRSGREATWIELVLTEGRNRQVRRMTAAVGLPTLRLVRVAVGPWSLGDLAPGASREVTSLPPALFARSARPRAPGERRD